MTEPESYETAASEAAEDARDSRAHKVMAALGIAAVLGVLVLGGVLLWLLGHSGQQDAQINHLIDTGNDSAKKSGQLADQVKALGATPIVQPAVPAPSGPTIVNAAPIAAPGPTQAQIDDAVAAYLIAHPPAPGKSVTPAMVATAVGDFLTAYPPTPGRPPTAQEIASAATDYLSTHAAQFTGATGQTGQAGKDATDAQVSAAVDAYCSTHGKCAGPAGGQGLQGVSFTDLQFRRDSSGTCQAIAFLHDPATGKDTSATHTAGDAACPVSVQRLPIPTK